MVRLLQSALAVMLSVSGASQANELDEYRVKALFLYNLTQFVEWPPDAFKDAAEPLQICILGTNPFERGELAMAISGKQAEKHKLIARHIGDLSQSAGCHVVFVSAAAARRARPMLADRKPAGLLTVGETPGFAHEGGVVNLVVRDGRVRLEVNVAAAEHEHLRISAKLLKLAEIVK